MTLLGTLNSFLCEFLPGYQRILRCPRQILGLSPFRGDIRPTRVALFEPGSRRPTVPFPHPWNYQKPIAILETFFWGADGEQGSGKHNRYLDVPGFAPILVTRDPGVIRAITVTTGDKAGEFDRDTLPSTGIAQATGRDTLLFANGPAWKRQRKLSAGPFGKTTLFQPEQFHEFEATFRITISKRLEVLRNRLKTSNTSSVQVRLEPDISAIMLEMLANNFFGANIPADQIRDYFVPAMERVISHIVRSTVINRIGIPVKRLPGFTRQMAQTKKDYAVFEELTDLVLAPRTTNQGLWGRFKSDAPNEKLRSNIRVFLAGALEATTSYASWAISHLARNVAAQDKVFAEIQEIEDYNPVNLKESDYFNWVMNETLRLTPALYFLPRKASVDTLVETADGRKLWIPRGTHILLDIWHANRHEDHWGVAKTGFSATAFVPERWEAIKADKRRSAEMLHFGFGHGPRVCPGTHLGQLEVGLVVGAFVKIFRFQATNPDNPPRAGVSTKPLDGTLLELQLRDDYVTADHGDTE